MTTTDNTILNSLQITQKTRRIAYQIYENNVNEQEVILIGIIGNGYTFTEKIATVLKEISPLKVTLCKLIIDKKNPLSKITTSLHVDAYQNKSIILIDDVLNSGATLIYAIKHLLNVPLKQFKTAVLVNRNHKKYPVKADFKGISLSTSTHEHVAVTFSDNEAKAFLME